MTKLSKTEEQLMQYLWDLGDGQMKDILDLYDDPKPATTTIATLLKRIRDKGFIDYNTEGKARRYFPIVKKSDYFSSQFKGIIHNFFGDSVSQFASFFTESADLSKEELEQLREVIDHQIEKKNKEQ